MGFLLGEIPDAAFIHAARKRRQMARELGDCPAVEIETSTNRLVREDENDASDDDDEKRRIVFSVKEKTQRQKIAEEIGWYLMIIIQCDNLGFGS